MYWTNNRLGTWERSFWTSRAWGRLRRWLPGGWLPASDLTEQCFAKGGRELESCFVVPEQHIFLLETVGSMEWYHRLRGTITHANNLSFSIENYFWYCNVARFYTKWLACDIFYLPLTQRCLQVTLKIMGIETRTFGLGVKKWLLSFPKSPCLTITLNVL